MAYAHQLKVPTIDTWPQKSPVVTHRREGTLPANCYEQGEMAERGKASFSPSLCDILEAFRSKSSSRWELLNQHCLHQKVWAAPSWATLAQPPSSLIEHAGGAQARAEQQLNPLSQGQWLLPEVRGWAKRQAQARVPQPATHTAKSSEHHLL